MNKKRNFRRILRISSNDRYKNFTFLEKPTEFNKTDLFSDKYAIIQLHDVSKIPGLSDVIGFCGVFKIENGKIISLDYDSYDPQMIVVGYQEFTHDNETCLDLLTIGW